MSDVNGSTNFEPMTLHFASSCGFAKHVEKFLNEGDDIDEEFKGKTALCLAIENNQENVVEILLRRGSAIHKKFNDLTYLHIAVNSSKRNKNIIKLLLNYGISINAVSPIENYTPLHFAVLRGKEDIVKLLLSKGADVNLKGKHGESPLHIAAEKGLLCLVKLFLMHNALVDSCTLPSYRSITTRNFSDFECPSAVKRDNLSTVDFTPLHLAVLYAKYDVVKFLLDHGAYVNAQDSDGKTALHIAVELGYCSLIELILSYNLDIDNRGNKNALVDAIILYDRNSELTRSLLDRGLSIDAEYINNINLLNAVVVKEYLEVLRGLIHYGADVNTADFYSNGFSLLHRAADSGSKSSCELLLNYYANVNIKDNYNNCPIFYAIRNGDFTIVKLLLDTGASVSNNIIESFNTAIEKGCFPVVELVLQHNSSLDINAADSLGRTPLLTTALITGDTLLPKLDGDRNSEKVISCSDNVRAKMAKFLLIRGANVNVGLKNGTTTLFAAAKNGFKQVVNTLLEYNVDVSQLCGGCSALHVASRENKVDIVEILLRSGCDADIRDMCYVTPIHIAAEKGFLNIVKLLLKYGASYKLIDTSGQTAFYLACKEGHKDVVEYLLKFIHIIRNSNENQYARANILCGDISNVILSRDVSNVTLHYELTPLAVAIIKGFYDIVEILLQYGVDANYVNSSRRTALHLASCFGITHRKCKEIINLLSKFGANLKLKDMYGQTALHIACQMGHKEIVNSLLESFFRTHGTIEYCFSDYNFLEFVDSQDNYQLTALMIAVKLGFQHSALILLKFGADPNVADNSGSTALHIACEAGHFCFIYTLLLYGSDINILTDENFSVIDCANIGVEKISNEQKPVCASCIREQLDTRCIYYNPIENAEMLVHEHDFNSTDDEEWVFFCEEAIDFLNEHMVKLYILDPKLLSEDNFRYLLDTYEGVIESAHQRSCKRELDIMKTYYIINCISFHDVLKKNIDVLGVYMKNKTFVNSLNLSHYQELFPNYCSMVFCRLKKGMKKLVLKQECVNCLYSASIRSDFSGLPVTCTENIIVYLSDSDMKVLLDTCGIYE